MSSLVKPQTSQMHQTNQITIDFILTRKREGPVKPRDHFDIPNICIPEALAYKRIESGNSLVIEVRSIFNSVNRDNIDQMKDKLKQVIVTRTKTVEDLNLIADEILHCMIDTDNNVDMFLPILNSVHSACIDESKEDKPALSQSLGSIFLGKCYAEFVKFSDIKEVERLATLSDDITDEFTEYNDTKAKMFNLIEVISKIYNQRKTPNVMKLTSQRIHVVLSKLLDRHVECQDRIERGEEAAEEATTDEEILEKMAHIYAEYIYTFLKNSPSIATDTEIISPDSSLSKLISIYKTDVVPRMTQEYLRALVKELKL